MTLNRDTHPVTFLLTEAGFGPRLERPGFLAAARLANAVTWTIQDPLVRARFVVEAATDLANLEVGHLEELDLLIHRVTDLAECAEDDEKTPQGTRELWGSLWQLLET